MPQAILPNDPDLRGALPALRRAADAALQLALETGTPCYILRGGKIVDIAAERRASRKKRIVGRHPSRRSTSAAGRRR